MSKDLEQLRKYRFANKHRDVRLEKLFRHLLIDNSIKYRRQIVIGYYIVDFLLIDRNLIVEIYEKSHDSQVQYDFKRELYLRELGFNFIAIKEEEDFMEAISKIKNIPSSRGLKTKAFSSIYKAASRGGSVSDGKQKLLSIYQKEGEERKLKKKKIRSKIYLWESMCGIAEPGNEKLDFKTVTPEEFLNIYLERQQRLGGAKYIHYIQNNRDLALQMATKLINLKRK